MCKKCIIHYYIQYYIFRWYSIRGIANKGNKPIFVIDYFPVTDLLLIDYATVGVGDILVFLKLQCPEALKTLVIFFFLINRYSSGLCTIE